MMEVRNLDGVSQFRVKCSAFGESARTNTIRIDGNGAVSVLDVTEIRFRTDHQMSPATMKLLLKKWAAAK